MPNNSSKDKSLLTLAEEFGVDKNKLQSLDSLLTLEKDSVVLEQINSLLMWDQEINMPQKGAQSRAEQNALIRSFRHTQNTRPEIAELLHSLDVNEENMGGNNNLPPEVQAWLKKKYLQWKKAVSVPPALITEIAKEASLSHLVWVEARRKNDYSLFAPQLKKLVDLQKQYAMSIGYEESPYDVLLDEFEPQCTSKYLESLFSQLKQKLTPLYLELCDKHKDIASYNDNTEIFASTQQQKDFCIQLAKGLGQNMHTSRIDVSAHPFCITSGWQDVRITTKYIENMPLYSIFSVLHEMGHALYELNVSPIYKNTLCSTALSLGVHESQSRFMENIVGRSATFWEHWHPILCKHIPNFAHENFDTFMARILEVKQNPVRVESDEVGYNLHIILRFEIERALFEDDYNINNLPELWNNTSKELLGISPKDNAEGVLQDVHWSEAAFGYFPTYALGNIYAAQLNTEMPAAVSNYETLLRTGNITPIIEWLNKRIHQYGASKDAKDLFPTLDIDKMISYLKDRYTLQ